MQCAKCIYVHMGMSYIRKCMSVSFETVCLFCCDSWNLKNYLMNQAVGALGELSDKSDFSLLAWDSFSQEIRDLLLFYCQKSLNLFQMQ